MQSFLLSALVASSTLLSAYAQVYPPVNVTAIDINVRISWCRDQTSSCKLLCQNQNLGTVTNDCYPDNLFYACTCSDGTAPNATEYSQTIPYFMCTNEVEGCVALCKGDSGCQSACTANQRCGASNPTRVNATSTTSSKTSASTKTGGTAVDENGFAITGDPSPTGNAGSGASRLIEAGSVYGMGLLVAGMAAGAAIVGL